ncbi:MAG: hypothetical protein EYC70_16740 [Planctomycetota bacterium]|nr:MAG: hypothetical protein EYC70_16740 [Planctomycetota bacterium]
MQAVSFRYSFLALALTLSGVPGLAAQDPPKGDKPPQEKPQEKPQDKAEPKAKQASVVEPETKIEFPATTQAPGGGAHVLIGTGAARKPGEKEPAYAVGIYVDESKMQQHLARYQGKDAAALQKDTEFYRQLLADDFPKSVRLVMARDVTAADLRYWLDQTIQERVKAKGKEQDAGQKEEADQAALEKFHALVPSELKAGTVLSFYWDRGGRLTATSNDKQVGTTDSAAISWALFDGFMGTNPISEKARSEAYKNLAQRVQAKEKSATPEEKPGAKKDGPE